MLISLTILWGDGYTEIIRGTNYNVIGFKLHHPRLVSTYMSEGEIYHKIDGREQPVADADMIHLMFWSENGITGKSLIAMAGESIGTSTAMQKFSARFFKSFPGPNNFIKLTRSSGVDMIKISLIPASISTDKG